MPKKNKEDRLLQKIIDECQGEYCERHKRWKTAKVVLTDQLLHPVEIIAECPECAKEKMELEREIQKTQRAYVY
ncbi:MAG: hypothetical protein V1865_03145 [bacterium]